MGRKVICHVLILILDLLVNSGSSLLCAVLSTVVPLNSAASINLISFYSSPTENGFSIFLNLEKLFMLKFQINAALVRERFG